MPSKTERLIRIYNRLRRTPVSIDSLHQWTKQVGIDVSPRQLYRDLRELATLQLSENELVIEEETGEKNKRIWKLIYQKEKAIPTEADINTFGLFRNLVPRTLAETRKDTLAKFDATLYKQLSNGKSERNFKAFEFGILNSYFYEYLHPKDVLEKIDNLIWSISNNRKVLITQIYHDNSHSKHNGKANVLVSPVCILFHRGQLHLCVTTTLNKLWIVGIDADIHFELTNETFSRKKADSIFKEGIKDRFGITESEDAKAYNIEIEITRRVADFMKNFYWHSTQQFIDKGKDTLKLTMRCQINRELIGWIVMWLNQMKVIKPLKLRNIIQQQAEQITLLYRNDKQPKEF